MKYSDRAVCDDQGTEASTDKKQNKAKQKKNGGKFINCQMAYMNNVRVVYVEDLLSIECNLNVSKYG